MEQINCWADLSLVSHFCDERFAVLPPHFTKDVQHILDDRFWRTILPCYDIFPESFKCTVPYLYASLLYHQDGIETIEIEDDDEEERVEPAA